MAEVCFWIITLRYSLVGSAQGENNQDTCAVLRPAETFLLI